MKYTKHICSLTKIEASMVTNGSNPFSSNSHRILNS
jgi:hypothetical protein